MRHLQTTRRRWLPVTVTVMLFALTLGACQDLLEVELPGSVTADALNNPLLAEVLVNSAEGDFECGFVDYMRFAGQWFEEFQNTSQSRPDALVGLRSALVGVYADPCASGTGPIWTTVQLPRQQAERAISFVRQWAANPNLTPAEVAAIADSSFLIAKARLYEAYSIQLLGEQFCGVTFNGGPEVSRDQAYDSAGVKFTEAIAKATESITANRRTTEATAVRNAAYVGRARSKLLRGNDMPGVVADALLVTAGFQYVATYDGSPARRRNRIHRINNRGNAMMPYRHYTGLTLNTTTGLHAVGSGRADPRVVVRIETFDEPRGTTRYRTQRKYIGDNAPIPFATWREARLMIAEADPTQALAIINQLRTSTQGLPAGVAASQWPLPTISQATWDALTPAQQITAVREERLRELWMQGTQAGDKIRWGYPAWEAVDEYGQQVGPGGCIPIPFLETAANKPLG